MNDDLISRQVVIDAFYNIKCNLQMMDDTHTADKMMHGLYLAENAVKLLPSAQPEAKPPKWVAEDRYVKNRFAVFPHCPQCYAEVTTGQCYCMICGQHIDWSEDDG